MTANIDREEVIRIAIKRSGDLHAAIKISAAKLDHFRAKESSAPLWQKALSFGVPDISSIHIHECYNLSRLLDHIATVSKIIDLASACKEATVAVSADDWRLLQTTEDQP